MKYRPDLKQKARHLRNNSTPQEVMLWQKIKKKQVLGVQFYRQRPIGSYIVDFYAPAVNLVIEADGCQHFLKDAKFYDQERTQYLEHLNLSVLRFTNAEINTNLQGVLDKIVFYVHNFQDENPPLIPPFLKGG